jgi:Tol biopolymer transport system component/tRNA A-37 threonylcarbamoyl transferase component Bud32
MAGLLGQSLGRYHNLEQLGEGGMAVVYKAYDTRLETEVAVKVIRTDALPQNAIERTLRRFEREAKALAKLTHPNIVKVMDYGEHEGRPYLVMPYLPGGTLKSRMNGKSMPWSNAARVLIPIANALEYAHEHGLIHRDIKPSNILITEKGQPMLADFGVAKLLDTEETMELTGTGVGIGTPEYMAPEQATNRQVDARVDIYALGVVLYEMLTGRKPYIADTPMAVMIMHSRDPLPRPRKFSPSLPQVAENILLKALAKDPKDRYQNMAEFARALETLASDAIHQGRVPFGVETQAGRTTRPEIKFPAVSLRRLAFFGVFVLGVALLWGGYTWISKIPARVTPQTEPTIEPIASANVSDVAVPDTPIPTQVILPTPTPVGGIGRITFASDRGGAWNVHQAGENPETTTAILPAESAVYITRTEGGPYFTYSWSPDGRKLLFAEYSDKRKVSVFDGAQVHLISDYEMDAFHLETAWSPDSNWLLFGSKQFTNNTTITTINVTTGEREEYVPGNGEVWSPDGTRIAFYGDTYWDGKDPQLFVMDFHDPAPTLLATGSHPQWSPDGTKIAYVHGSAIQLMHADGGYIGQAGVPGVDWGFEHNWSPDSAQIAYIANDALRVFHVNDMTDTGIFDQGFSGQYWADFDLAWSPDGKYLALGTRLSQREGEQWVRTNNLVIVNMDTQDILHLGEGDSPVFSPDSKMLVFASERDGNSEIYIANVDGSGLRNLTNHPANDTQPAWIEDRRP